MLCLFSTTHDVIFFHRCFCWLVNAASAVKTNDAVNFQLVGVSSNFAEKVWFNPCPSQPRDTRAIERNQGTMWEVTEEFADAAPEGFDESFGSLSQERLQFRKSHLDRVQVGRGARQETQFGALGLDRFPDFRALVRGEIVDQTMSPGGSVGASTSLT